jgi:DNA-directed RNA polymerase subunit H
VDAILIKVQSFVSNVSTPPTLKATMSDRSNHKLVPTHELLDEDEALSLLAEYRVTLTDLPKIKISDAALPPNVSVGDIIKITRVSRTIDTATVYRMVVE